MVQSGPRSDSSLENQVLERLAVLPHGRANTKTLARELGLRGEARQALEDALDALSARGALIEIRGHYALPERQQEYATGKLNLHRDGYGFLTSDRPLAHIKGDIFLPPGAEGRGMHGDRVLVRIGRLGREGKAEGSVVRILGRAHPTVVGEFRVGRRENYVVPQESRIRQSILIPEGMELPRSGPDASPDRIGVRALDIQSPDDMNGMIVNVEIVEYPEDDDDNAVGRVVEILGRPDDFGVDVEVTILKHHLPNRFPAEVLEQAQAVPPTITGEELRGRRDFRDLPCVTIDGETARDFDDAVYADRLPNGHFVLHVHIIPPGYLPHDPLDIPAELEATILPGGDGIHGRLSGAELLTNLLGREEFAVAGGGSIVLAAEERIERCLPVGRAGKDHGEVRQLGIGEKAEVARRRDPARNMSGDNLTLRSGAQRMLRLNGTCRKRTGKEAHECSNTHRVEEGATHGESPLRSSPTHKQGRINLVLSRPSLEDKSPACK